MISNRCTAGVVLALISALALGSGLGDATDGLGSMLTGGAGASPFFGGSMMGANAGQGPGMLGALSGAGAMASQSLANAGAAAGASSALTGGDAGLVGNSMRMAQGFAGGMASAMGAGMGDIGRNMGFGDGMAGGFGGPFGNPMMRNFKRSLGGGGAAAAASSAASSAGGSSGGSSSASASSAGGGMEGPAEMMAPMMPNPMGMGASDAAMAAAAANGAMSGDEAAAAAAAAAAGAGPAAAAGNALAAANSVAASNAASAVELAAASAPVVGRQALALDALRNAQAESALAGSEMAAHGDNNARSAALASNAYRQAKLASARDRVNIAGTIQNSARISDAAIATHDAATKAEDSLLGSELAVDSAATVLDSDGAYIPPVTSSLLRSLPYGRLGLRNIIPKPLTHPSSGLPDVWLNGYPVTYGNVPLRSLAIPFGYNPVIGGPAGLAAAGAGVGGVFAAANGGAFFNQPLSSNNGLVLNGMVFDPAYAYLTTNLNGVVGTSELPIIANGQLEAQDEIAMANLLQMQQLNGFGMSTTYQGYGRLNPVPMITGSVTDANLMPTTTIGTTYPIGSTLVIEPRDSFFQDYNDNASSKQNFDERQQ